MTPNARHKKKGYKTQQNKWPGSLYNQSGESLTWEGPYGELLPAMTRAQGREDLRQGYMAGSQGVPSRHSVAVEVPVVILQLLQAVKSHKAVLAVLLNAQEVVPPAHGCTHFYQRVS